MGPGRISRQMTIRLRCQRSMDLVTRTRPLDRGGEIRAPNNRSRVIVMSILRPSANPFSFLAEPDPSKPKGPRRLKPFRTPDSTPKFPAHVPASCEASSRTRTSRLQSNLSGSRPIVANRACVILAQEILLSTKKRTQTGDFL